MTTITLSYQVIPFHHDNGSKGLLWFHEPLNITLESDGKKWFATMKLGFSSYETSPKKAVESLAQYLIREMRRLLANDHEKWDKKGQFLSIINIINSDIHTDVNETRTFVGDISGNVFIPWKDEYSPMRIPEHLRERLVEGSSYFAIVPVYRDGTPSGPIVSLEKVGKST